MGPERRLFGGSKNLCILVSLLWAQAFWWWDKKEAFFSGGHFFACILCGIVEHITAVISLGSVGEQIHRIPVVVGYRVMHNTIKICNLTKSPALTCNFCKEAPYRYQSLIYTVLRLHKLFRYCLINNIIPPPLPLCQIHGIPFNSP